MRKRIHTRMLVALFVVTTFVSVPLSSFGQYGRPWDFRFGTNFFPFKNKVVRWNTEALYLYKFPVGYTSVPYPVGGKGWVFHSSMELAF